MHIARVPKRFQIITRQKNKQTLINKGFAYQNINAGDRNRTGTGIATHGILSPGRLPVPPRRHFKRHPQTYLQN